MPLLMTAFHLWLLELSFLLLPFLFMVTNCPPEIELGVEIVKLVGSSFLLKSTSENSSIFTSSLNTESSELYLVLGRHFLSFTGVSVLERPLSTFLFWGEKHTALAVFSSFELESQNRYYCSLREKHYVCTPLLFHVQVSGLRILHYCHQRG